MKILQNSQALHYLPCYQGNENLKEATKAKRQVKSQKIRCIKNTRDSKTEAWTQNFAHLVQQIIAPL